MSSSSERLRWGVIGAGRIARDFVAGIPASRHGVLAAVASRDLARSREVAARAEGAMAYGDYESLLADPGVDAVYIATLHPRHASLIDACARAGKHILCEKPLTVTGEQAEAAAATAAAAGVVLVEAMMYRFQPQTERIRSVLAAGLIGTPVHVDVSCAFTAPFDPADRLFDPSAGGGAILDVGCYAMSFARMVAGAAAGDDAVEPAELTAGGHLTDTGVDDWAVASLVFPGGADGERADRHPPGRRHAGACLRHRGPPSDPRSLAARGGERAPPAAHSRWGRRNPGTDLCVGPPVRGGDRRAVGGA